MHGVLTAIQDLYEERRNQFFSDLADVEQWLQETREAVQEVLQEEREGLEEREGQEGEGQAVEVGGQDKVFQGMATLQSKSDSQAAVDTLIIALKVRMYVLIQWSPGVTVQHCLCCINVPPYTAGTVLMCLPILLVLYLMCFSTLLVLY